MFTPINSKKNCLILKKELNPNPTTTGHQVAKPTIIVKTAPILKT
jgi:hypothetical protein